MRWTLIFLLIVLPALAVFVRFAPTNRETWHQPSMLVQPGDYAGVGSFLAERRIVVPASDVLSTLETLALATPRTKILAGSVQEGMITFVTRSRIMGFPDYTTVTVHGESLTVYGRLRFGKSDMGVNRARILGWLNQLGPLTESL